MCVFIYFFFQAEDGIRDAHWLLKFRRVRFRSTLYPSVPGHEIVGRVSAVGANVSKFKAGDIAGVGCLVDSCRTCSSCGEGLEQYCENGFVGTYNGPAFGGGENTLAGYSDNIVVDEKYVRSEERRVGNRGGRTG